MRADYGESAVSRHEDEVEVRCIMRVPGEPDKEVVARMPEWAVPRKGGRK